MKRKAAYVPTYEVGQTVVCAETGKSFVVETDGCTFNVATRHDGALVSDEGVHISEVRALLDRTRPFTGYLSSDGKHLTGWKGNVLGTVVHSSPVRLTRRSWCHGSVMQAVRIRDVHGALWYGRGSPGVVINVRPMRDT